MGTTTNSGMIGPAAGHLNFSGMSSNSELVVFTTKMSTSYATGGDTIALPSDIKSTVVQWLDVGNWADGTRFYQWDGTTGASPKIKAYTAAGTEVANTTNLSAVTLTCLAVVTR
jgi:hypothetical protein